MKPVSGLGAPYAPYSPSARPAPRFTQVLPGLHFAGLGEKSLFDQWSESVSDFISDPLKNNVYTTAYNYYTKPTTSASGLVRGYYAEGGYVYLYDPSSGAITIVSSPRSASQVPVSVGTSAYNAILSKIRSGSAAPVTPDQVKQYRASVKSKSAPVPSYTPAPVPSYTPAPVSSVSVPSASTAPASSGWSAYAPWLVLGAGAVVAVGLVLTAPKRQA